MDINFYKAIGFRLFAIASAVICGLVSLKLYGKYLLPDTFGVILVGLQIMGYLPLLDGGFRTTVNRKILADTQNQRGLLLHFSQTLYSWMSLIAMLVAFAAMMVYNWFPLVRGSGLSIGFLLALGFAGACTFIFTAQIGLLVAIGAQSNMYFLNALSSWVATGVLWMLLHHGYGVWAFPLSSLAAVAVAYPSALWMIRRREAGIKFWSFRADSQFWQQLRDVRRDALASFRSQVSILLLFTLDVVMVGVFCSAKETAVYGILLRIFGIIRSFLQTVGEVGWPVIAQRSNVEGRFSGVLLRLNAWMYGSVLGAVMLTVAPFLEWYMGSAWTPPAWLVYLLAARFLINGVSAPAGYFLIGLGDFVSVARFVEREFLAALILSLILGFYGGMKGIALAFVVATVFGTFTPILSAYARAAKVRPAILLSQLWWRALLGFGTSLALVAAMLHFNPSGYRIPMVGILAVLLTLFLAIVICCLRYRGESSAAWRVKLIEVVNRI